MSPTPARPENVFLLAAHRHTQARHLGKAAGYDSRAGIVASALTITHTGGNSDDVFQHTAQLTANDIRIGVDAETGRLRTGAAVRAR